MARGRNVGCWVPKVAPGTASVGLPTLLCQVNTQGFAECSAGVSSEDSPLSLSSELARAAARAEAAGAEAAGARADVVRLEGEVEHLRGALEVVTDLLSAMADKVQRLAEAQRIGAMSIEERLEALEVLSGKVEEDEALASPATTCPSPAESVEAALMDQALAPGLAAECPEESVSVFATFDWDRHWRNVEMATGDGPSVFAAFDWDQHWRNVEMETGAQCLGATAFGGQLELLEDVPMHVPNVKHPAEKPRLVSRAARLNTVCMAALSGYYGGTYGGVVLNEIFNTSGADQTLRLTEAKRVEAADLAEPRLEALEVVPRRDPMSARRNTVCMFALTEYYGGTYGGVVLTNFSTTPGAKALGLTEAQHERATVHRERPEVLEDKPQRVSRATRLGGICMRALAEYYGGTYGGMVP